jgi:LysM repeat protein
MMIRRNHILVLITLPLISVIVAWVFCLQENLQQVAQRSIWLEENLQMMQERLDCHDKEAENEALLAKSESVEIQENASSERNDITTADSLVETVHIIQAGENLHTIGMKYDISWKTLMKHNSLDKPNTIYAGQALKIP